MRTAHGTVPRRKTMRSPAERPNLAPKRVTAVPPNVGPDAGARAVITGGRSTVGAMGEGAGTKDGAGEAEALGDGSTEGKGEGVSLGTSDGEGATGPAAGLAEGLGAMGTTEGAAEGLADAPGAGEGGADAAGVDDGEADGAGDGGALGLALGGKPHAGPGGIFAGSKAMGGSEEVSPAAFPMSTAVPWPSSPKAPKPKQITFLSQRKTQLALVPETISVTKVRLSLNEIRLARLTATPPAPAMLATESFPFWPEEPAPKQSTLPESKSTHVELLPALTRFTTAAGSENEMNVAEETARHDAAPQLEMDSVGTKAVPN